MGFLYLFKKKLNTVNDITKSDEVMPPSTSSLPQTESPEYWAKTAIETSNSFDIGYKMIERLSEYPELLVEVAMKANEYMVAVKATDALTDTNQLMDVALRGDKAAYHAISIIVKRGITDPEMLENVASHAVSPGARGFAVSKINNKELLLAIMREDKDINVRTYAAIQLKDEDEAQTVLNEYVSDESSNALVRIDAAKNLRDQETAQTLLTQFVQSDRSDVRLLSAEALDDKELARRTFLDIALNDDSLFLAKKSVSHLSNQDDLQKVITRAKRMEVRDVAIEKLKEIDPTNEFAIAIDKIKAIKAAVVPFVKWNTQYSGSATYHSCNAQTLLRATEILRDINSISQNVYYVVDTPDGSLGRDRFGFFTEAPIKSNGICLEPDSDKAATVDALSLTVFGDAVKSQSSVAILKSQGQYASFMLEMECGHCGYKSPVETKEGDFERQCYSCGTVNRTRRGKITVMTPFGIAEI